MQFPLELTENNVKKLMSGQPTQLKKEQLHGTKHYIKIHPMTHKKLTAAKLKGTGIRLTMTPQEFEASGEGFMDILRGIKKGAMYLKNHVIDSNLYQSAVKPLVKQLVDAGVTALTPTLGPLAGLAQKGVNELGSITNAYGLEPVKSKKKGRKPKKKATTGEGVRMTTGEGVRMTTGGSFLIN